MSLEDLEKHYKGGTGSGDFGHTGRPGKIGGSGGGGGKFARVTDDYMRENNSPDCKKHPEGCNSLNLYSEESLSINSRLRGISYSYGISDEKLLDSKIHSIDKTMIDSPGLSKGIIVTRGIDEGFIDNLQPGDSFQDKGYTSTTLANEGKFSTRRIVMTIKIPKGAKGLYLGAVSAYPSEKEFLLPKGSKFNVDARRDVPGGNVKYDVSLVI